MGDLVQQENPQNSCGIGLGSGAQKSANSRKRCARYRTKVTITDKWEVTCAFDWHQHQWPWMTLNGWNVTLAEISKIYEPTSEDRPMLSAAKCRRMIVVTKNIRYIRIFAGGDVEIYTIHLRPNYVSVWNNSMGVAYLLSWSALRRCTCFSQFTTGLDCTWLYPVNDYQGQ